MDQQTASELLCYCLGMEIDEIRFAKLKELSTADWDCIVQQSVRHKVAPLLYKHLKLIDPEVDVPTSVMQELQERYAHHAAESMLLYHQLSKLLKAFQDDAIPLIVLKGAHLAQTIYGNTALRPMGDVDLLVRETDLLRVEDILFERGYSLDGDRGFWAENHYHFPYASPDGSNPPVEIHWHILGSSSPFKVDVAELWARARPTTIADVATLALSPEDLLLYLCMHSVYVHSFSNGLRPLYDISETIRHYKSEIDWQLVQYRAHQWGARKCVYIALSFTRKFLAAPVPGEISQSLKPDDFDARFVDWIEEGIFVPVDNITGTKFENWARMGKSARFRDKVSIFIRACFPPPQHIAERYELPSNSIRVYLHYPVYLNRLLHEHGRQAWLLLRGDDKAEMWLEQQARWFERKEIITKWLSSA